ncbi:MAG: C-terminus of permease, partial [Adhaeribacter sp.]|nr:C-terminus of permease [Adhaeribacter sp.]
RLLAWLAIGLVVYFLYSRHHSKLNKTPDTPDAE